jgi:hypothetical protein
MLLFSPTTYKALSQTLSQVKQQVSGVNKELIAKYGSLYIEYEEFINRFNKLDWEYIGQTDKNLGLLLRLVKDYYFLEALAGNTEEMNKVLEQFKKQVKQ